MNRIFELASDADCISAQIQHHMSKTRRALITPMLISLTKNALDWNGLECVSNR